MRVWQADGSMGVLHPLAHALRPVRVIHGGARYYSVAAFPADRGVSMQRVLRRCEALKYLREDGSACSLEVLDAHGRLLQTLVITGVGFEYLVLALGCVLEAYAA
jgi:hypothetical protein